MREFCKKSRVGVEEFFSSFFFFGAASTEFTKRRRRREVKVFLALLAFLVFSVLCYFSFFHGYVEATKGVFIVAANTLSCGKQRAKKLHRRFGEQGEFLCKAARLLFPSCCRCFPCHLFIAISLLHLFLHPFSAFSCCRWLLHGRVGPPKRTDRPGRGSAYTKRSLHLFCAAASSEKLRRFFPFRACILSPSSARPALLACPNTPLEENT